MGFWDSILSGFGGRRHFAPQVFHLGDEQGLLRSLVGNMTATQLWRSQPHLRTVIGFRARNVAQLGLHCYRREADGGRVRDRDSVLAQVLANVDGQMTPYELIYALVGDHDLYDRAFWIVSETSETQSGWMLQRLPPAFISPVKDGAFRIKAWLVSDGSKTTEVPTSKILHFRGFDPGSPMGCSPAVEALKGTIQEQVEAAKYRGQVWKRGGRVSAVLQRPMDAPEWSDAAREAFREDWYAKYTGDGPLAGGTPILEDGMTLNRIDFTAQEQQFVEASRLSLETVAAAFYVMPAMVGMGGDTTYSNIRAFRKMLYTETLGPLLAQIEDRINHFLVPMLGLDPAVHYVEFNIAEKLQGDFEEQAVVLSSATGRPWMTANEARARQNLPALPSGNELVVPLNVLVGGQASPRDSGSQNEVADPDEDRRPKGISVKSRPAKPTIDKHAEVLADFFARQGRVVRSRLGAKADWWDEERWDGELTDDLVKLARMTSANAARRSMAAAGLDPDDYDVDRTMAFLREASRRNAERINRATYRQLDALDDMDDDSVAHVFDVAAESRAPAAAYALAGFAASFGTCESAEQVGRDSATKTWVVNSGNPRSSHAALNGETVGIKDEFSNGLKWPGAFADDADETAGCQCSVVVSYR